MAHFARMPLFYLHMCDGNGFTEDEEGLVLENADGARQKAISGARDIMASDVRRGELDLSSFIEVEDENHQWLFTVTFAEAIAVKDPSGPPPRAGGRKNAR